VKPIKIWKFKLKSSFAHPKNSTINLSDSLDWLWKEDSQIPVTQLKGDGDKQAAERDCNAPPTRYLNIWLCGRQTDLSVMGVKVGVANFFWVSSFF